MLYTTVDAWKTRYPKLSATNATSATLFGYLEEASDEADGYLSTAGITVPVSPAPPVLVGKVQALATVYFFERNVREAGKDAGVDRMRTGVMDWFQALIDKKTTLVASGGGVLGEGSKVALWSNLDAYTPTFGASDITAAEVDPDRIDDEEDAR